LEREVCSAVEPLELGREASGLIAVPAWSSVSAVQRVMGIS